MHHRIFRRLALSLAASIALCTTGVAAAAVTSTTAGSIAAAAPVFAFPSPGSEEANPATSISLRGVSPADVGIVTVTGDASGAHRGTWTADSDARGSTFRPDEPFAPGERVTVRTRLGVVGGASGTYAFAVARPSTVERSTTDPTERPRRAAIAPTAAGPFRTRPDLQPPALTVRVSSGTPAPGVIALTPNLAVQAGPLLVDNAGHVVWYHPLANPNFISTDAKIVHYNGQDDLAWWQGAFLFGHGNGEYELVDQHYNPVATIRAGNGLQADLHDMQITPQNTAIVLAYAPVAADLTAFGGPSNGTVLDNVIQEVDIPTGNVLFEWHSLDHIGLDKSLVPPSPDPAFAWDYLHMNAIAVDNDGNLLVSGRHSSNVYKVNRTTGALMWTLGRGGDFAPSFPVSGWFQCQHDVRRRPDGTISVFDNGGTGTCAPQPRAYSRGLVLSVDEVHMTASFVRELRTHPDVVAATQGAFRALPGGHDFIGWGQVGELSEYDSGGTEILDMTFEGSAQSYRAIKAPWDGRPTTSPDVVIRRDNSLTTAFASWNGATDVAAWEMRTGPDTSHLATVAVVPRTDFETTLQAVSLQPVAVVQALDAHGAVLGSRTLAVPLVAHNSGYWTAGGDGSVRAFGDAPVLGNASVAAGASAVGIVAAAGGGYWVASSDGGVSAVGAPSFGSLAGVPLAAPVVGIAATPDGGGYWLVGSDGGVFAFGDARFFGSMAFRALAAPITGLAAAPDGNGYALVAADGGVFSFGSAHFEGSMSGHALAGPVVGITETADDGGYWLVATDGGVFAFGDARFFGSRAGAPLSAPVVAINSSGDAGGYWLLGLDGGVFAYGDAEFRGSASAGGVAQIGIAHT